MAEIIIESETPIDRGWSFRAVVKRPDGAPLRRTLRLSWADYDLWSRGTVAPERVAAAVVQFLVEHALIEDTKPDFDAAGVRRLHPDIDAALPGML